MGDVSVAVHQPNYLPWLGYFHKISRVDIFVFLDNVQFERRGYTKRTRVMGTDGKPLWLTQDICKQPVQDYLIQDVTFSDRHWISKHLKTLEAVYRKTPHFREVYGLIEKSLRNDTCRLAPFNGTLIQNLCTELGLPTRIMYASRIGLGSFSSPSERIACITRHLGGTFYLSGAGAKAYNDIAVFKRHGIQLAYNDFVTRPYLQRGREFHGGLSIIDALFNIGFEGVASLLQPGEETIEENRTNLLHL